MNNKYLKESIHWIFIAVPFIYLAAIYNNLPVRVPIHFNFNGEPDNWANKTLLFLIPTGLGLFIYLLMLAIPAIDPKKKIKQMGEKYFSFRLILTAFCSLMAVYLLYITKEGRMDNPNIIMVLSGLLFAFMGNYFQTVRPNYFIGFRTPWTLENEDIWRKTHKLAGKIWMAGGILIALFAYIIPNLIVMLIVVGVLILTMIIIPLVFSYREYKKVPRY